MQPLLHDGPQNKRQNKNDKNISADVSSLVSMAIEWDMKSNDQLHVQRKLKERQKNVGKKYKEGRAATMSCYNKLPTKWHEATGRESSRDRGCNQEFRTEMRVFQNHLCRKCRFYFLMLIM